MRDKYYDRAKKGAALLDRELGPGWEYHINLKDLDLAQGPVCMLGQLYGRDYIETRDHLFGEAFHSAVSASAAHGFTVDASRTARIRFEFEKLTRAWGRLILHRISARFRA